MRALPLLLGVALGAACSAPDAGELDDIDDDLAEGKGDTGGITPNTADAYIVVLVANTASEADLRKKAGLGPAASAAIVDVRTGDDKTRDRDDIRFASLKQLDDVPYVGPQAFKRSLAYGKRLGYTHPLRDGRFLVTIDHDGLPEGNDVEEDSAFVIDVKVADGGPAARRRDPWQPLG